MSDCELAELVSGNHDSLNEDDKGAFQAELLKRGLTVAKLREQYPQESQSNGDEGDSQASVLQEFGFLIIPVGGILALILYASLRDSPFWIHMATLVAYTSFVFTSIFCNLRSSKGYDLRQKAVRQKIPRLLVIHAGFLAAVIIGLTVALWVRPCLPPSWLVERGRRGGNWFELSLMLIGLVTYMAQVHICRKTLSRSARADHAN